MAFLDFSSLRSELVWFACELLVFAMFESPTSLQLKSSF